MKVKELIDYVNSNEFYSLWDMEDSLCSDFLNKGLPQLVAENLEKEKYRWYEVSVSVFKLEDGFVGVKGVSFKYTEILDDYIPKCSASEYQEAKTLIYKIKYYEKKN